MITSHDHHHHRVNHHHALDDLFAGRERFRGDAWFERGECGEPRWLDNQQSTTSIIIIIVVGIIIIFMLVLRKEEILSLSSPLLFLESKVDASFKVVGPLSVI